MEAPAESISLILGDRETSCGGDSGSSPEEKATGNGIPGIPNFIGVTEKPGKALPLRQF